MKQAEPITTNFTHVVSWLIAPHTESLRSRATQRRTFLKALDHLALARLGERLEWNRR
jgi:hypothetical protein